MTFTLRPHLTLATVALAAALICPPSAVAQEADAPQSGGDATTPESEAGDAADPTGAPSDAEADDRGDTTTDAPRSADEEEPSTVDVSGLYTIWGLNQRGFLLGADHPLDEADYVVQMLRTRLRFGKKAYGAVARVDAAQGWWGTDNAPNNLPATTQAEDGTVTTSTAYNPYKLFRFKDTNYLVHVDRAYLYLDVPALPVRVTAGRQYYGVGNKLVLDQDLDGVIVSAKPIEALGVDLMWAKVSEGRGSVKSPSGALMNDDEANADANLFGARAQARFGDLALEGFGLFYSDISSQDDYAFLPSGLGYFRSRFAPHVSRLWAFGVVADADLDVLRGLHLSLEVDWLTGEDLVDNDSHAGGLVDVNNGSIGGYNLLASATQKATLLIPVDLKLTFGLGSGDDDPTSGPGNVNKIQTMGFFPLTNVWEDSVMPDVAGISPQGLGSPVSRGYRELENTTALQLKAGLQPHDVLRLEASWTWLHATAPIRGFDANGVPTNASSSDIGQEIDANAILTIYDGVTYKALFGYFTPGDGAALLINGDAEATQPAWELKQVASVKF